MKIRVKGPQLSWKTDNRWKVRRKDSGYDWKEIFISEGRELIYKNITNMNINTEGCYCWLRRKETIWIRETDIAAVLGYCIGKQWNKYVCNLWSSSLSSISYQLGCIHCCSEIVTLGSYLLVLRLFYFQ